MKAKYIGDPRNPKEQLPDLHTAFGVEFARDKFVDVPDEKAAKFAGNSHYETKGDAPAPAEPPKVVLAPVVPVIPA